MMRRRPLMRAAATTAVVAGTATAVSGRVRRRQDGRDQQAADAQAYQDQQAYQEQQAYQQPVYQQPAPAPQVIAQPSAGISPETMEQLKGLGDLHEQGILTDEEFAAAKAKILG